MEPDACGRAGSYGALGKTKDNGLSAFNPAQDIQPALFQTAVSVSDIPALPYPWIQATVGRRTTSPSLKTSNFRPPDIAPAASVDESHRVAPPCRGPKPVRFFAPSLPSFTHGQTRHPSRTLLPGN